MNLEFAKEIESRDGLCVYFIDSSSHPLDFAEVEDAFVAAFAEGLTRQDPSANAPAAAGRPMPPQRPAIAGCSEITCNVVRVSVDDWGANLTPWPAPGIYRGEADFGGAASATLDSLVREAVPAFETEHDLAPSSRAIMGYSLGGLFALYSFMRCNEFSMMASLSGSMWYDGLIPWIDGVLGQDPQLVDGRFACFVLGKKEKRAASSLLKSVQDKTEHVVGALSDAGCSTSYDLVPGGHMSNVAERYALAFARLLA